MRDGMKAAGVDNCVECPADNVRLLAPCDIRHHELWAARRRVFTARALDGLG